MILSRMTRIWSLVVAPLAFFGATALMTEDRALILILSIVQVAVAAAVEVAFFPEICRILRGRGPMDRSEWMAYGIWISWFSVDYRTVESLIWRLLGQPAWIINSDITSAYLFIGAFGAMAHVIKPGGLGARVPPREMIRLGAIVGVAVAIALLIVNWSDIEIAWRGPIHKPAHSRVEIP